MLGRKAVRATAMLASAARSADSACSTSGRRSSTADDRPAGTSASQASSARRGLAPLAVAASSGTGRPSSRARALASWARWRSSWASVARAWATRPSWACSSSWLAAPAASRSCTSFRVCSRLARVWRARASSSSSACSARPACSTAATRLSSVARRAWLLASHCASAASLWLARRPNRSISQLASCTPALSVLAWLPWLLGVRLAFRPAPRVGRRAADVLSTWASARCTLAVATRRSRLWASASVTQACSRGDVTTWLHSSAGASSPAAADGRRAGTSAWARARSAGAGFQSGALAQPARASAAIRAVVRHTGRRARWIILARLMPGLQGGRGQPARATACAARAAGQRSTCRVAPRPRRGTAGAPR